jgi:hypothetical protein
MMSEAIARRSAVPTAQGVRQGDVLNLDGRTAAVWTLDTLPYVENDVTRRFRFDRYGDPVLEQLRRECRLDDVIAPGHSEYEKQLLLMIWVTRQIEFGDPAEVGQERDPLRILDWSRQGRRLYCENNAALMIAAAASLGWVSRPLDLAMHSLTEIWSNDYRKWILLDPTDEYYVESHGEPLGALEIRQDWFANDGRNLTFFRGCPTDRVRGRRFGGFHLLYYPHQRELLGRRPADGAFMVRDAWSGEGPRHILLERPEELYFPVNQAAMTLAPEGRHLRVTLRTLTPNFKGFRFRQDGGAWREIGETFTVELHGGVNLLETQAVNLFGVGGPISVAELCVGPADAGEIIVPASAFSAQGCGKVRTGDRRVEAPPSSVQFWHTKDHWLEWTVEAPQAGDYDLTLTYATMFNPVRCLALNGQTVQGLEAFPLGPTRSWLNFAETRLPARVALAQGRNVLRLTCLDNINLCLATLRLSRPDRPDLVMEAITASGEGGGRALRTVSPSGGLIRFWDGTGHWLEWTLDHVPAGSYRVSVHYAALKDALREVRVNGQVAPGLAGVTLAKTGGWDRWMEAPLPAPLKLQQGRNTLRLTNVAGQGLNLADLRLLDSEGREIVIPAVDFTGQDGGSVLVVTPPRHRPVYGWNSSGHWLEWIVTSEQGGKYNVVLRCVTDMQARRELRLNGQPVDGLENVTLTPIQSEDPHTTRLVDGLEGVTLTPSGKGPQRWQDVPLAAPLTLEPGRNVLRLTNVEGPLNLDEIRLTRVGTR